MAIDGDANTAWGIEVALAGEIGHKAVFVADKPIENDGGTIITNIYLIKIQSFQIATTTRTIISVVSRLAIAGTATSKTM